MKKDVFIGRAEQAAANVSAALEEAVGVVRIGSDALFDSDYVPIVGTNPVQLRTRFPDCFEAVLQSMPEPLLGSGKHIVFCAAVDSNGYLPVHDKVYWQRQRPDDIAWNTAHCRNRRIFDDRAGLVAARNTRPHLMRICPRDVGNGVTTMMREIGAPIRVFRQHWGGFRTAFKL